MRRGRRCKIPLNRFNSSTFHRFLYGGQLERVILLKRLDDQQEGSVTAYTLYECRHGNTSKNGEAIQGDIAATHSTQWVIPNIMLQAVGVNYINVLDRIVDQFNTWWEPESPQTITLSQWYNYTIIECLRIDPNPNIVLYGIPGIGLPLP